MPTYELISRTTLSAAVASVALTSIPQTYKDLRLVTVSRSTRAIAGDDFFRVRFNSDSGTNYSNTSVNGNGTSAAAASYTNSTSFGYILRLPCALSTANLFAFHTFDIFGYTGSTFKSGLITQQQETNNTSGYSDPGVRYFVSTWRDTTAIDRIDVGFGNYNLEIGTTISLFGIKESL